MIARVPVKGYFEVNSYFWVDEEKSMGSSLIPVLKVMN